MEPYNDHQTDQQIFNAAKTEWTGTLLQLWHACNKPLNEKQIAVYVKQLGHVQLGVLERVISRMLREHTWSNVPTIGEIWKSIQRDYGDAENPEVHRKPCAWRLESDGRVEVLM